MSAWGDWLEHRTGYRRLAHEALFENIPGGARWRYVWGSTLVFCFAVQVLTGLFLWMGYSPSSLSAWESVFSIQYDVTGGWLLRGIHHYTAAVMNVLLLLHLMQVIIDGAYKAPREINFWFGLGLLNLVLALSLTGYLLPWDQKGFWATRVATNILSIVPVVGPKLQRLVLGGTDYGHHTLTRFFALHAGVLPLLVCGLVALHIYLFRRHGITAKDPHRGPDQAFWPDQVLKDAVACLAVMVTVLFLVLRPWLLHTGGELGAELGAPADAANPYSAARPEWYFLFLFQMLKYFPGESEVWGAVVLPSALMLVVCLMPILGRWRLGHRFNVGLLGAVLAGVGLLTWLAVRQDRADPAYQAAVRDAIWQAARVKELARSPTGIPPAGAASLLRTDPLTQGPRLFARNCASCHRYGGQDGIGAVPTGAPTASDLKGFASRTWLAALLAPEHIAGRERFGGTKFRAGKMVKFVQKDVAGFSPEQKAQLADVIKAVSAEAGLPAQHAVDEADTAAIARGRTLLGSGQIRCTECHEFRKPDEDATAPDLTGYGSREWLLSFLSDPGHPRFYGTRNDRMPAFGANQILDRQALGLIVDWLRGDWYEAPRTATAP